MHRTKLFCLRVFGVALIFAVLVLYTVNILKDKTDLNLFGHKVKANSSAERKDGLLVDISNEDVKPNDNRSIYFLLTQAAKNDTIALTTV